MHSDRTLLESYVRNYKGGAMRARGRWWAVFAAVMGLIVGNGPVMQFSFGVFIKPLAADFATSRATISSAVLIGLCLTGVCTPIAGRLIDRFGIRRVTLPAIVLFSLSIAALSLSPATPYAFIALYGLAGIIAAGQTPLPYAKAIAAGFEHDRGLALGVSMAGVGIGTALVPQIAQALISAVGWREAYFGLGLFTFLCAFPAVYFFLPDPTAPPPGARIEVKGLSGREALGTSQFWYLAIIFFAVALAAAGSIAHIVPILTDRGVPPQRAAGAISVAGLALIFGRLLAGYLLDKIFAPYVAFVLFVVPLVGIGLLLFTNVPALAFAATICIGLGLGAEVDLIAFLISRYLGMRSFGEIYGYLFAVFMLGSGLGPFLMGLSFSKTGSYETAFIGFAFGLCVACVLVLFLGSYCYPAHAIDVEPA